MVGSSIIKCFDTKSKVKPGNVAKLPFLIALIHVLLTRQKYEACRNQTSSFLVWVISSTADTVLVLLNEELEECSLGCFIRYDVIVKLEGYFLG